MPQEFLLPGVRLDAKHFPYKQHRVVFIQLGKGNKRISVSGHISYYAFFIFLESVLRVVGGGGGGAWRVTLGVTFGVWRVTLGVWRLACGVWRYVLFFTLRFIFFGRRLVLQLPPPPLALTGGVTRLAGQAGAASAWTYHVA